MKLLDSSRPDFFASLDALTHHAGALDETVDATVAKILADVRARGDEAHLLQLFGEPYRDYLGRVNRWIPGIY